MKKITLIIALILIIVCTKSQTPIATIQENSSSYVGDTVTIEGVITIGAGVLRDHLSAYIQDTSGRGLMIFDWDTAGYLNDIKRGNRLEMTGIIDDYESGGIFTEIKDFTYEVVETGVPIDSNYYVPLNIIDALYWEEWEGTLIELTGTIDDIGDSIPDGYRITIKDGNYFIDVWVWSNTEISHDIWIEGATATIKCVVSIYDWESSLLPGYIEDIEITISSTEDIIFSNDNLMIFPNPIESTALIEYILHQPSNISLRILDLNGKEVLTLINEIQQQGKQSKTFDFSNLKSGVYFCVLKINEEMQTTKLIRI